MAGDESYILHVRVTEPRALEDLLATIRKAANVSTRTTIVLSTPLDLAVVASLFLTIAARSDPLSSMWTGADQGIIDIGRQLQRIFPAGGEGTKFQFIDFSGTAQITGVWVTDNTPVLEIRTPDDGHYYWRAVTYDHFDGHAEPAPAAGLVRRVPAKER